MAPDTQLVLVGSYAKADQPGIFLFEFDSSSGGLTQRAAFAGIHSPSFLALHPNGTWLYSVSETSASGGAPGGVCAIQFNAEAGTFALANAQPSGGDWPCHLSIDPSGRWLIVSNYGSGSVSVLPIEDDGALGEATQFVQHSGSGPNAQRQEGPHAHSATPTPDGQLIVVADLGIDKLILYRLSNGALARHSTTAVQEGAGPRHVAFGKNGDYLYLATELGNTVVVYSYDSAAGALQEVQTISTLPDRAPESYVADIHGSNDGKRLYVSNRGDNSIAAYTIGADGRLALASIAPCGGNWPRNFAVSPDDAWLLVANQNSGDIAVLPAQADGTIGEAVAHAAIPGASFVKFL